MTGNTMVTRGKADEKHARSRNRAYDTHAPRWARRIGVSVAACAVTMTSAAALAQVSTPMASTASMATAAAAATRPNVLKPAPRPGPVAQPPAAASSVPAQVLPQAAAASGAGNAAPEIMTHGRFESVPIFRPQGEPNATVLFFSDDDGWTPRAERMARALADTGALVAGIDTARLIANYTKDDIACVYAAGDLDNFGRWVEAAVKLPGYTPPILVGDGVGGTFAYAMLAQAGSDTFSGALSVDFCPVLPMSRPLCQGEGVHFGRGITHTAGGAPMRLLPAPVMSAPWMTMGGPMGGPAARAPRCSDRVAQEFAARTPNATWLVGGLAGSLGAVDTSGTPSATGAPSIPVLADWVTQYKNAFRRLNAHHVAGTARPPAAVADLPVIEVPATGKPAANMADTFAILLSGDGGWAGLDRDVAGALSAHGIPVVGIDSLRYFWSARTPASGALDIDRLMRFYQTRWNKKRVILIGYSQGADVLPFMVNRLPPVARERVGLLVLMGLGQKADFEFRMTNWVMSSQNGLPIRPEVERLPDGMAMCVYGADENDSNCPGLDPKRVQVVKMPGGHHFDGNYTGLADVILQGVGKR
ncbi:putative type iv secretory pathway virj component-related protein [Pandoraea communis]|uniref:Putative type iv secretory pathway virj component-related protein n=1 Tax=Pandoraea communis TaxID=2508297 RepID=A0A5E4T6P7_9BURK|nr:AcvB/VirJ family lysyl-phosphatidylglycerol hydrolase [Pandoraea communis]VVD83131.1 putative type iv secretory pathway virj component-related protein [Pandoraea communis]